MNKNNELKEIIEKKFACSIKKSKTSQILLIYLIWKTLTNGEKFLLENQRDLANSFCKHYNSINLALEEMRTANYLKTSRLKKKLALDINLDKIDILSYLLLVSNEFAKKVYAQQTKFHFKVTNDSDND